MVDWNVHYGILTCYNRTVFLHRPKDEQNGHTLIMSKEYKINEKNGLTPFKVAAWFMLASGYLEDGPHNARA